MQPAAASAGAAAAAQRQEEKEKEEEGEQQQPQAAHLHNSFSRIRTGKSQNPTAAVGQQLRPRRAFAGNRMATCLCLRLCARSLRNPPQMNAKKMFRRRRQSICSGWLATQHNIQSYSVTWTGV